MVNIKEHYMRLALQLALKAKGKTFPNPLVGAIVVKDRRIVGRGFHAKAGFPHAEIIALQEAGAKAQGSTLYVTLEPCVHFGRTPPCVDSIIASKVKEVVIGMIDPNPLNNGRGVAFLKQRKINVTVGVLENESRTINEVFIKYITKKMPLVTVKVAQSLDGKIATFAGDAKWITSDASRAYAHRLRAHFDAIMVGVNTVLRDDPSLDAWFSEKHPIKIIVDSHLSTPATARIFAGQRSVIIVTLAMQPGQETQNRKALESKARILEVKEECGQINLKDMLKKLAKQGIGTLLVEGGGTLVGSLVDKKLVDKFMFFMSPKIIGGKDALSPVMGKGIVRMDQALRLRDIKLKRIAEDFLIEGNVG
ncbi:MAG: bifunctional diaminohydroxyphosphoribosylaminopyrimidine deaminase/5-amino-6-(5-phosphoribosylamino)uracil reductase RibD [Candidatus Omnitrophica bacterium]|nr:bifunctional diaminohydroxyphosphoribosylaminopyrimidine deaminase/5-amino-6-(5-phosphoribosylamino)uracil reductase RibD [Candidatus Omnitrophota bacterium]